MLAWSEKGGCEWDGWRLGRWAWAEEFIDMEAVREFMIMGQHGRFETMGRWRFCDREAGPSVS